MITPKILYEDNHLIAVLKPFRMLTQEDWTEEEPLYEWVKNYIKIKYEKPGKVFLGMLHRLNRPAAGVVLFARTGKAAKRMTDQFKSHLVYKRYFALVNGKIAETEPVRLVHFLRKNRFKNKMHVLNTMQKGAKYAELEFTVKEIIGDNTLIEVDLKTGRQHQIRAQLSQIGHPIVGDIKYGAPAAYEDWHIALWGFQLKVMHPTKKEPLEISELPPENWLTQINLKKQQQ